MDDKPGVVERKINGGAKMLVTVRARVTRMDVRVGGIVTEGLRL